MSIVSIVSSTYKTVLEALLKTIDLTGELPINSRDTIAIKINMCDARPPETGTITHPLFLDAFLCYLREKYRNLNIFVVESDATVVIADEFIQWFGYMPILEKWGAKWHNLSKGEIVDIKINGNHLKSVPVPKLLTKAKLISLSKLKTNSLSKITCSLKNQFGCLPIKQKSVFHDKLAEVIVDANLAMPPIYSIVDGIIGVGGPAGPSFGIPVHAKLILASKDPVAVDSASAKIIGYNPRRVKHIRLAERAGLGSMKYDLVGDSPKYPDFGIDRIADFQGFIARKVKEIMIKDIRTSWKRSR